MKTLTPPQLVEFLRSLQNDYDLRVPVRLHDGTRTLGALDDGPLALQGGPIPRKITSLFFPQAQTLLQDNLAPQHQHAATLLVVGLTAPDAACLEFTDRFFAENLRDDLYFRRRDRSLTVCVTGRIGDQPMLKIAGHNCDLELVGDGPNFLLAAYTDAGRNLAQPLQDLPDAPEQTVHELQQLSQSLDREDTDLLQTASRLLLEDRVPDEFWQSVADRCIACTSCNLACPTCTCFDVFDTTSDKTVTRRRIWDSCQLDGFMREASGHNPMGHEYQRSRRRIHHKLAADPRRWGHITCFLCGRCDELCPTGIGMLALCREMVQRYADHHD